MRDSPITAAKTWRGAFSLDSLSGPSAELVVTAEQLQFKAWIFGTYEFTCDEVVSIDEVEPPWLSFRRFRSRSARHGIRLRHTSRYAPEEVILWPVDPPAQVISHIRQAGFIPRGVAEYMSVGRGWALRLWVVITLVGLWSVPSFLYFHTRMGANSEWLIPVFFGPALVLIILMLRVNWVQKVSLKPGRHVSELRPWLVFLAIIFGLFFAFYATWTLTEAL